MILKNTRTNEFINVFNYTISQSSVTTNGNNSKKDYMYIYDIAENADNFKDGDVILVKDKEYVVVNVDKGKTASTIVLNKKEDIETTEEESDNCDCTCGDCCDEGCDLCKDCNCDSEFCDEDENVDCGYVDEVDALDALSTLKTFIENQCYNSDCKEESMPKFRITIDSDGKEQTLASLHINGKLIDVGMSKKHPEDSFSFENGAFVALSRLFNKECKILKDSDNNEFTYVIGGK